MLACLPVCGNTARGASGAAAAGGGRRMGVRGERRGHAAAAARGRAGHAAALRLRLRLRVPRPLLRRAPLPRAAALASRRRRSEGRVVLRRHSVGAQSRGTPAHARKRQDLQR
eukprot:scaffold96_cov302-Prasinococcus_capsulatus_cf.AAC.16